MVFSTMVFTQVFALSVEKKIAEGTANIVSFNIVTGCAIVTGRGAVLALVDVEALAIFMHESFLATTFKVPRGI